MSEENNRVFRFGEGAGTVLVYKAGDIRVVCGKTVYTLEKSTATKTASLIRAAQNCHGIPADINCTLRTETRGATCEVEAGNTILLFIPGGECGVRLGAEALGVADAIETLVLS